MKKANAYLLLAIFCLIAFATIAYIAKTDPFHSSENIQIDINRHIDYKIRQITSIYDQLQAKNNDQIANEISRIENNPIKIFVYGQDETLKVWSDDVLPNKHQEKWWVESENSRICFQTKKNGSSIIGCEDIKPNGLDNRNSDLDAIHFMKQSNTWVEFIKFIFFFSCFFFSFLFIKTVLLKKEGKFSFFVISSLLLCASFIYSSDKIFNSLGIFNSSNYNSGFLISPGSFLFGSLFILFLSINYSAQTKSLAIPKYIQFYFILPSFLFVLFLKGLEHLFQNDSSIQFEYINFETFSLWGYSLAAIVFLYSIHLLFQTFISHLDKSKVNNRYYILACILLSYLAFHFLFNLSLPWYVLVLYLICYYFSLELNSESLSSKLIWSIWFLILNAGLLSSVLYYYTIKKDIIQTQAQLSSLYTIKDQEEVKSLVALKSEIVNSSAINSIHSNEGDEKFSKEDLISYLNSSVIQSNTILVEDIFIYSPEGESRIINEGRLKSKILSDYFQKLTPDGTILYNPISNRLVFDFTQSVNEVLVCLKERTSKNLKNEITYGLFKNKNPIDGDIKTLPEIDISSFTKDSIINKDAVSHIFHKVDNSNILYSRKMYSNLLKPISLFSFIFCLSGLFVFLISVLSLKFDLFKSPFLNIASFGSLSTKIQMVIIFLILISFLAIAVVTSLYFNQILRNNQEKSISAKVITINNSLQNRLASITDQQSAHNLIENDLPNLSDVNNVTAYFYSKDGLSTNDTDSEIVYPFYPYYQHKAYGKKESYTIQSNNIVSAYFPLTHPVLGNIGYISLDDKNYSKDSVKSSISEFLSSMLNLYVFLFFIAGALAIGISKSITRPLTALQLRLKSIKFGSKNEIIEWEANDEIGDLISSYNDMLVKLEQNIELLAKTERDTAWREMAKQVAHEIKNPLTPMKLSIQYLKRAIQSDPQNSEKLVDKISTTLIEQIDNLAEIANAFSNFATLPQANNDKINLNEVVEVVHDLFRKRDDMDIKLFEPLNAIEVFADKNHMIRILNNLVKNAIQSIPEERKGIISISLYKEKDKAVIKVEDNGKGIPKELQEKVFTPYFTTKTSGTGLGLAISANMLNAFDGHMYFETKEGKGTSFFIEIPLMRETYKYHEGEKLILD